MATGRAGLVVALKREARALAKGGLASSPDLRVTCSGPGAFRARNAASALADAGAVALMGVGLSAGLRSGLASGCVIVARSVIGPDGRRIETDAAWAGRAMAAFLPLHPVLEPIAGCDGLLATPTEKLALSTVSGAAAADMESHALAHVASERNLPLLIVRVVADDAATHVPAWLVDVIGDDGSVRAGRFIGGLAGHPADFPAVLALGASARQAETVLGRVAAALAGLGLAFR